jgi:signal transduction histidine kinase
MPVTLLPTFLHRPAPFYNVAMGQPSLQLEKLKKHIDFHADDVANLRVLGTHLEPFLDEVTDTFYRRLFTDPQARRIFSEGEPQIARQRKVFRLWLGELFCGRYDTAYFQSRVAVGRTHVKVGMPQHFMFTAFEIVRQALQEAIDRADVPEPELKMRSLNKLLTLETTMMLESYKEHYASNIRREERTVVEEKLTRAEHLAQLGQLAASLAHEIKNPLAGISGAIQVIRDGMLSDNPHREVIREILAQINRLDDAVKDLLVYARPRRPVLTSCNLAAVVDRVVKMHLGVSHLRGMQVRVTAPPDLPAVPVDAGQFEQLLVNLLFNAAHASPKDSHIDIALKAVNGRVCLTVTDYGHGMDDQTCDRAFEPFFTTKAKGTGLGLPICTKIVEAHGGTLKLQSRIHCGTRAIVELPIEPDGGHDGAQAHHLES